MEAAFTLKRTHSESYLSHFQSLVKHFEPSLNHRGPAEARIIRDLIRAKDKNVRRAGVSTKKAEPMKLDWSVV
jgi:hypothetical protein